MAIPIDIALENVKKFSADIAGIKLIFSDMEKVETWIAKKGRDEGFTTELRQRLYDLSEEEIVSISTKVEPLLWILFYLPSSTSFYLLSSLNEIATNISDILLETSTEIMSDPDIEDKRHAQIFIDRCCHLNASNFVSNITNPQFSDALDKAIKKVKEVSDVY